MTLLIRTTSLTGFSELVSRLNGNPETLLESFNLTPEKVANLEGVLPYRTKINLIEEAAKQLQRSDFGLMLAQEQDLMVLGPLAVVALNSPTVKEAARNIIQYMHYHSPGLQMSLEPQGDGEHSHLVFRLDNSVAGPRQNRELTLGLAQNAVKMLCGGSCRPQAILMQASSPLEHGRYKDYFEAPVYFGRDYDALVLSNEQLDRPIDQSNPALRKLLGQYIKQALLDKPLDLANQVKQLILNLLPTQRCNLQMVANQLGLHKRTLQRRLSEQSIIFEELLDTIRRERSDCYLMEAEMPMTQVAGLLGYREQSSLNRACRRWHGMTPLNRRRQLRRELATAVGDADNSNGLQEPR